MYLKQFKLSQISAEATGDGKTPGWQQAKELGAI